MESIDVKKNGVLKRRLIWLLYQNGKHVFYEVSARIDALKSSSKYHRKKKTLDDKKVIKYLNAFHQKYVIVPTDKATNNFSVVCKTFYINCLLKELNVFDSTKRKDDSSTYIRIEKKSEDIVKDHLAYMKTHNIVLTEDQESLPSFYWIPKMHKNPSKQRFIAASHCCTTKPLSKSITYCLKLIQQTHKNYCKTIFKSRGFNRMWIVDNSVEVLNKIYESNKKNVRNIRTYDFSTLYTCIPHELLKERMAWVINQCFNKTSRQYIRIGKSSAVWHRSRGKGKNQSWNQDELIKYVNYLIDNIYVVCGDALFRQVIGIPMGTDCAPFLANLFLYSYEYEWLLKKFENKEFDILNKFNYCFRYIDDLLCINNDQLMDVVMKEIYPQELALTSDNAVLQANYLDLSLEISNNKITHKLYDKRDAFGFSIVNFPDLSGNIPKKHSYGVFVSQLIRYARCCQEKVDFIDRSKKLIDRLVKQNFSRQLLRRSFDKFAISHYELLFKYRNSTSQLCDSCCR